MGEVPEPCVHFHELGGEDVRNQVAFVVAVQVLQEVRVQDLVELAEVALVDGLQRQDERVSHDALRVAEPAAALGEVRDEGFPDQGEHRLVLRPLRVERWNFEEQAVVSRVDAGHILALILQQHVCQIEQRIEDVSAGFTGEAHHRAGPEVGRQRGLLPEVVRDKILGETEVAHHRHLKLQGFARARLVVSGEVVGEDVPADGPFFAPIIQRSWRLAPEKEYVRGE